jgi:nitroreductase
MSYDLEEAILNRRSTRLFLRDRPVPKDVVIEALEVAAPRTASPA